MHEAGLIQQQETACVRIQETSNENKKHADSSVGKVKKALH